MVKAGVIKCQNCGWVVIDDGAAKTKFSYTCPRCAGTIYSLECIRCGYEWAPNNFNKLPKYCPLCKSPYWNKPRVRGVRRDEVEEDTDKQNADNEEEMF